MMLAMPVMGRHDWTERSLRSLLDTAPGLALLVVDNDPADPFLVPYDLRRRVGYWSGYVENVGFYRPLGFLARRAAIIGLVHNDVLVYEPGWDTRVKAAFSADSLLGLVGFCGSWKLDGSGGRGDGTMCFFRGEGQPQAAGTRITDLRPSLVLDSLFMAFRAEALADLEEDWDNLPPVHFYDKIWPLRLVRKGWHVATLGIEVDHWGGITAVANPKFAADCALWCKARGIPPVEGWNYEMALYFEAERRLFAEFKGMMPSWVDKAYQVHAGDGPANVDGTPDAA